MDGPHVIVSKTIVVSSLKIVFVLVNSLEPGKILYDVAFHLGLPCFFKVGMYKSLLHKGLLSLKLS